MTLCCLISLHSCASGPTYKLNPDKLFFWSGCPERDSGKLQKRTLQYKFIEIQGSYHPPFLLQAIVIVSTTAGSPEPALGLAWHNSLSSTILVSFPQPPLQSTLFSLHGTQQRHTPSRSHPFTTDLLCTPKRKQATIEIVFYYLHLSTAFCPVPASTWWAPSECHSLFDFV